MIKKVKKVRFNDKIDIHTLCVWDFAYRNARIGNWAQIYLDNQRFKSRCITVEKQIKKIFNRQHRNIMKYYIFLWISIEIIKNLIFLNNKI